MSVPRLFPFAATLLTVSLLPALALAHPGHGPQDFAHGLLHPVSGLDHLLAMVAVGFLAAHIGGKALWGVPLAFVSMMTLGGGLGLSGVTLPFVEGGIALSLVVFAIAIAVRGHLSMLPAMALVGAFAIFHGFAHGAEMPLNANAAAYALGFILATSALHLCGIGLALVGRSLPRPYSRGIAASVVVAMALVGIARLTGAA